MPNFKLIKSTKETGDIMYYINKDETYLSGSMTWGGNLMVDTQDTLDNLFSRACDKLRQVIKVSSEGLDKVEIIKEVII